MLQEINSLGLNEQELLFLAYSYENSPHSNYFLEMDGQPELLKVVDILEWILNKFGLSEPNPDSKLTRIHFHSLTFHLIAEIAYNDVIFWSNTASSLMSGAMIASKQACGFEFNDKSENSAQLENLLELKMAYNVDNLNSKNIFFKVNDENKNSNLNMNSNNDYLKFNSSNPVLEFNRGNVRFTFTPVLVCKKPSKTVGLGDAISSNGLLYAIFDPQ